MKKTFGELVDALITTNIKIFMLVERVQQNKHTLEDAKKIQDLNKYRSKITNAINEEFGQQQEIKL